MSLITPQQIKQTALKIWEKQKLQKNHLEDQVIFPLSIPFKKPTEKQIKLKYLEYKKSREELQQNSKEELGYGYSIDWQEKKFHTLGPQRLPGSLTFQSSEDFLRFIGKQREFQRFCQLVKQILEEYTTLREWLIKRSQWVLEYEKDWDQLLSVCQFFIQHPRPNQYLRELEISHVDTKFIESHKQILKELLDQLLPESAIDQTITGIAGNGFSQRYGLKYEETLIRFRILDSKLDYPSSISDLSIPLSQFQQLDFPCQRILITENKTNGLSFPPVSNSIVIFGLGYGIQALKNTPWFLSKEILYWGDLDTHGFSILSQMRGYYPQTKSLLMDQETLLAFQSLWGQEEQGKRHLSSLKHLNSSENHLYQQLCDNKYGESIRLEQEKISYSYLLEKLQLKFPEILFSR